MISNMVSASDGPYVVVGFKFEKWDIGSKVLKSVSSVGRWPGEKEVTIMHGQTFISDAEGGPGYGDLTVALEPINKYMARKPEDRGIGAVSGGFIYNSNNNSTEPYKKEQQWGAGPDDSSAHEVALFYGHPDRQRAYRVMAWFDVNHPTPIYCFYRNGKPLFGPNIAPEAAMNWGLNIESYPDPANYSLLLAQVKSKSVERVVVCPPDMSKVLLTPDVVATRTCNNIPGTVPQPSEFQYSKSQSSTVTYSIQGSASAALEVGFKVPLPFVGDAKTKVTLNVTFEAGKNTTNGDVVTFSDKVSLMVPAHTILTCTAVWYSGYLSVDGDVEVKTVYTNGAEVTVPYHVTFASTRYVDGHVSYDESH